MDYTVHWILQARILEWVAFPFSRDLPNLAIEPKSPALRANSLPAEPQGKPKNTRVGNLSLSSRSSQPRNRTGVSCIAGGFFTNWAIREACGVTKSWTWLSDFHFHFQPCMSLSRRPGAGLWVLALSWPISSPRAAAVPSADPHRLAALSQGQTWRWSRSHKPACAVSLCQLWLHCFSYLTTPVSFTENLCYCRLSKGCPERSLTCVFQRTDSQEALYLCQRELPGSLSAVTALTCVSCLILHPEKEMQRVQVRVTCPMPSFSLAGNGRAWTLCPVPWWRWLCLPGFVEIN